MNDELLEKILSNLEYTNDEAKNIIRNNISKDVNLYLKDRFDLLLNDWNKENKIFDIPSGIVSISVNGETNYISFGNKEYNENTIFDLASMSKLYTISILFDVIKDYNLSLDTRISDLTNLYEKINYLTFFDLIKFNHTYVQDEDIRKCNNREDAIKILRSTYINEEKNNYYLYSDIGIMILVDVLELYTNISYYDLFNKYIIKKYDLNDTYLVLNDTSRYVSINGKYINDPKANIMGGYHGHAGVKTTSSDFIKFLNNIHKSNIDFNLCIKKSNALDGNNNQKISKSIIGYFNLSVPNGEYYTLASDNLPKCGFAIQGSVRDHAEMAIFNIDGKEYAVTISIFLDLNCQYDNALKYERVNNTIITRKYNVDGIGELYMVDIRNVLPYTSIFRNMVNCIGVCRVISLYNYINNGVKNE